MARYITTTLPYVNADPHIGHALEFVRADTLARTWELEGKEVFFNTGTDEHGQKIYEAALANKETPQEYADRFAARFKELLPLLGIKRFNFIRTTDPHHVYAAQEMWRVCEANGYIYKAKQKIYYCVGCELEKTESELVEGRCPLHPNKEIEIREEENYFFRFSEFQEPLLKWYREHQNFVIPHFRQEEIKKFVESGLQDFSISRLKSKMPWGVPVPGDDTQVMYVWFDALTNYISATGWPDKKDFGGLWPGIQLAGKDNLRQQTAIWQAMLMAANLPNSTQIYIGGFINSGGQKMSKSLGNVISPYELVEKYGTDATRYLLLRHVHPFEDTDITWERLDEWYTAHLVNGLGNLVARVMRLAEDHLVQPVDSDAHQPAPDVAKTIESYEFQKACDAIWSLINQADGYITVEEPFKVIKHEKERGVFMIQNLVRELEKIAKHLAPIMPESSEKILKAVRENKKPENLFPRIDSK